MKPTTIFIIFSIVFSSLVIWYTCDQKHCQKDLRAELEAKQQRIDSLQIQINNRLETVTVLHDTITEVRIRYKEREAAILEMSVPESTLLLTDNIRTLADTLNVSLQDTLFLQIDSTLSIQDTNILPVLNVSFERSRQFETICRHQNSIITQYELAMSDFSQIKAICDTISQNSIVVLQENERLKLTNKRQKTAMLWSLVGNAILITTLILK